MTSNSLVVLAASFDGYAGTSGFTFKKDGTYEWINGSGLGVGTKYGSYQLNDIIIVLDTNNIDNVIRSKYLLIRTQPALWSTDTTATYVFQVDSLGHRLNGSIPFFVHIDNRVHK